MLLDITKHTDCQLFLSASRKQRVITVLLVASTAWSIISASADTMRRGILLLLALIASGMFDPGEGVVPYNVNISAPNDTLVLHKIGKLYPSINN